MSNYNNLIGAIRSVIKANGNNEITGPILQTELVSMITTLGAGYQYMGVAQPSTNPGTPDARVMYLAYLPGTYANFGGLTVSGFCVLKYDTVWTKEDIPISGGGGGDFLTKPDDLTLEAIGNTNILKFADRTVGNNIQSGLNYKILREDLTFAEQVIDANTIYEIRYDFALSANFTVPSGCELRFNGGSILGVGHTITMTQTLISGNGKFRNCEFAGSIINGTVKLSWFTDGMTAIDDYTVDHYEAVLAAMKLTALKKRGWLDFEKIPVCIKQTIVISQTFGNIGMRNGYVVFLSSSNSQSLFDYQETVAYSGNYSPIIDFYAVYIGTVSNQSNKHENVNFIRKTSWSDTIFTYWRDIYITGFTGYFMVNQTYLQEVTFQNITADGCGFISNNSDEIFGSKKGSGNILHFLNCNMNNGASTGATNIHYLWDLYDVIEAELINIVCQGRIPGSNIYPLHISSDPTKSYINSNITIDGFHIEYADGHVNGFVLIDNAKAAITLRKNSIKKFEIVGNYVTINFEDSAGSYIYDVMTQSIISDTANVDWKINGNLLGQLDDATKYNRFRQLVDKGIISDFKNGIAPYPAVSVPINIRMRTNCDLIANYAGQIDKSRYSTTRMMRYFSNENGVDLLCFEDNPELSGYAGASIFIKFRDMLPFDSATTLQGKATLRECIYRATILVDVTAENISDVICQSAYVLAPGTTKFITPKVGDAAGTTTGWVRAGFTWSASDFTLNPYLSIKNCRLEFAYCVWNWRNGELNNDILLKNGVISCPSNTKRIYNMKSVTSSLDNVTNMAEIIRGAKGIFVTPKNVYMYVNGAVRAIYDYNAKGGTTSQRPTLSSGDVGFTYYDTTLNKTIVWNGSAWVNMDGTPLS